MHALRKLVARMDIVAVATALIQPVFNEVEQWAPRMDFADACAVVLARNYERAFVLTTDFRDFSAYRVPFASPEGAFHV
jgi:predicted nucleic acid-binding protein